MGSWKSRVLICIRKSPAWTGLWKRSRHREKSRRCAASPIRSGDSADEARRPSIAARAFLPLRRDRRFPGAAVGASRPGAPRRHSQSAAGIRPLRETSQRPALLSRRRRQACAQRDARLKKERGTTTGLSDAARDLDNNTIDDRARYLDAQRQALSFTAMPKQKQLIESRLKNDDLNQADEQLRKAAQNKWGGIFNRLLSSVNVANVMTGNYTSAAVESAVQQLMAFSTNDMSIEERRALALLNEHLRRYPDDPRNPEVRKRIAELEKKKRTVLAQKQVNKAEEALGKKDFEKAEFYYQVAAPLGPLSKAAEAGVDRMSQRAKTEEQETKKALQIARPPARAQVPENREIAGLLYALTLRDDERIRAEADQLEKKFRNAPQAEVARDARSVALEITGNHEDAKKLLQQVARSSNNHERDRAKALIDNPEYNLLATFQGARTKYQMDTVKYVLLGDDFLKKN